MLLLCLALLCLSLVDLGAEHFIRVESGEAPIENAVITVPISDPELKASLPKYGLLQAASGEVAQFQRTPFDEIAFVLSRLERQSVKRFKISPVAIPQDQVYADLADGRISIVDHGKKVFTYQGEETPLPRPDIKPIFKRGGYIHPVYSPSGILVTDDYSPNHLHHHGIWFPWTKTEFEGRHPDFWNMGEGTGKVEFTKFGEHWSGPVQAGFQAEHRFVDLASGQPKTALNETWTVAVYHIPGAKYFLFDLTSTQTCASASALTLPKYYYGGLGFRGNWAWNGRGKAEFLTSNGETDRVKANETRANWCFIGGAVEGQFAGTAIFCHPQNFRAPQPMRLHPTEPFFCYAPSQLGDWQIEQGKPYISRYRFAVMDGHADPATLDRIWNAYAHPPKVIIEKR